MGVDTRRPPLPAPTETASSMDDASALGFEVATNVSRRTDKTSYSIPEDGTPIVVSTHKLGEGKEGVLGRHGRQKSQTSLLIEYFEAGKTGDKSRSRPSVRVKVTPSASRKSKHGNDAIQITGIGKDRKPSYTRRISLGSKIRGDEPSLVPEGTEISHSSESNLSGRPPVEIEVLNNGSDISASKSSRGLLYAHNQSEVSSMPADSLLDDPSIRTDDATVAGAPRERSRSLERDEVDTITKADHLKAPTRQRSRSLSRERITQKVMEKLGTKPRKSSREHKHSREYDDGYRERRQRSSKSHRVEGESISGAESSLVSSHLSPSERSYRSNTSKPTSMNNPKLLEMVEDTIKRMILPEINALKEDQKTDRNLRSFEHNRRESVPENDLDREGLSRRVSKSSSTPHLSSKPKVVLNRDGDDPGTVLSRGDSERRHGHRKSSRESYKDERPSSRRSSGNRSVKNGYEEETVHQKRTTSGHHLRDAAAAGIAGGVLTTAALRHHDSQGDITRERRKHRTKSRGSRSRSNSIADAVHDSYTPKEEIPPMPLASHINDSELTRDSILSVDTARPESTGDIRTPIREVSRGSVGEALSPASSRTPTRNSTHTPVARGLHMSHSNQSAAHFESPNTIANKARIAALASAGLGAATVESHRHHERSVDDKYGSPIRQRELSPVQSVSSLKRVGADPLVPQSLRPRSAASRSSAEKLSRKEISNSSLKSAGSSPITKFAYSRKQSQNDTFVTPMEHSRELGDEYGREGTPNGESVDDWYEREHLKNEQYRHSMFESTNRDSYQTNPYSSDEKRFTSSTNDSMDDPTFNKQDVRDIGASPEYIHSPVGVESAVASLLDPSTLSGSGVRSTATGSPSKGANGTYGTYSDRMSADLRDRNEHSPALYEGATLSETEPSVNRWEKVRQHAQNLSGSTSKETGVLGSPRQSPAKSLREEQSKQSLKLGASGIPVADDPMPEIGHGLDDDSDLTTNPSIIQGPLGGDATGKETWPYTPSPVQNELDNGDSRASRSGHGKESDMVGTAAGAAATLAATHAYQNSKTSPAQSGDIYIDRQLTPTSPAAFRDEGYATEARSAGVITPKAERQRPFGQKDVDDYQKAMDDLDLADDDPFVGNARHARHLSGNSHGMASPLYDSATGKGINNIESKDIVALMDHLTVRDAQRNARDTEILVTLVRSASEMRQSFNEMKRFIADQDQMIMTNTARETDKTAQKVLGGPRPQPSGSPRTLTRVSEEDIQTKRKGVLRRALKGLTGGKSHNDLAKVEDMLMQILDNVEDLKHQGGSGRRDVGSFTNDSMDSYEKLRAAPDSGYEPEGQAGTGSTPNHSGHFSNDVPSREKQQFHSGYDGRRGSANRVSTVLEGDEDDIEPHEAKVLNNQFERNERLLTPTQEVQRKYGLSPFDTPPQQAATYSGQSFDVTPKTAEKQRKHKSNNSSIFGVPKVSRWSKTTTSSAAPDPASIDSPDVARRERPSSEASRSLADHEDDRYAMLEKDRQRSTQSLAHEQEAHQRDAEQRSIRSQGSRLTRTPSPLVPSERSYKHEDQYDDTELTPQREHTEFMREFEDPKYQAHRNSLLLQHPQPRQGTTGRHQNTLEVRAQDFGDMGTDSDLSQRTVSDFDPAQWGSTGTAALARNRLSNAASDPMSPISTGSGWGGKGRDESPLVPDKPAVPPKMPIEEEPNHGSSYGRGMYYTSPLGSGHLLEPIPEVRYSLETDSGRRSIQLSSSPDPQASDGLAVDMRSPARKITGPRPMGSRSASSNNQAKATETSGTVRRKPGAKSQGSRDSLDSETF